MAKRKAVKLLKATVFNEKSNPWTVHFGRLNPGPGNPGSARLFQVLGEKLPFEALNSVRKYLKTKQPQLRRTGGQVTGWRPNMNAHGYPVLVIDPYNHMWSARKDVNISLGCWDLLTVHLGHDQLPLNALLKNDLIKVAVVFAILVLILPLYALLACWLMDVRIC